MLRIVPFYSIKYPQGAIVLINSSEYVGRLIIDTHDQARLVGLDNNRTILTITDSVIFYPGGRINIERSRVHQVLNEYQIGLLLQEKHIKQSVAY